MRERQAAATSRQFVRIRRSMKEVDGEKQEVTLPAI
jgi:hypothetical protein